MNAYVVHVILSLLQRALLFEVQYIFLVLIMIFLLPKNVFKNRNKMKASSNGRFSDWENMKHIHAEQWAARYYVWIRICYVWITYEHDVSKIWVGRLSRYVKRSAIYNVTILHSQFTIKVSHIYVYVRTSTKSCSTKVPFIRKWYC